VKSAKTVQDIPGQPAY